MEGRGAFAGWSTWFGARPADQGAEAWQDFAAALSWILGLQLLDLLTTLGALANGAAEANPLAAALLASGGPGALVQLKVVVLVLMLGWVPAFALVQRPGRPRTTGSTGMLALLVLLVVVYSAVVVNNLAVLALHL